MNKCPKCSGGAISGPRYVSKSFGREVLQYQCNRCGYIQEEKTHDNCDQQPLRAGDERNG